MNVLRRLLSAFVIVALTLTSVSSDASRMRLRFVGSTGISAPVLTLTDGAVSPPTYDIALDSTVLVGDTLRDEIASNSGFTGSTVEDHTLTSGDLLGTTITYVSHSSLAASTTYYWRNRVVRGAALSPWSNTLNATTPAAVASQWVAVTGANKSQYATVSGTGNLTAVGSGPGFNFSPHSVRADTAKSGKRQFQVTLNAFTDSRMWVGVDDGTDNFADTGTTNFSRPGKDNSSGVSLFWGANGASWEIWVGTVKVQNGAISSALAVNDKFTVTFDTTAGTVAFYKTQSGSTTQLGTTVTGLSFGSLYADVGFEDQTSFTALFGSGQTRALDSGYSTYDP